MRVTVRKLQQEDKPRLLATGGSIVARLAPSLARIGTAMTATGAAVKPTPARTERVVRKHAVAVRTAASESTQSSAASLSHSIWDVLQG